MNHYHISFYVPKSHLETVKNALFIAGAGQLGNYEQCAWQTLGQGQFKPKQNAKPTIGQVGKLEYIEEYKVEIFCQKIYLNNVIESLKNSHPYEEVAYSVVKIIL